MSHFIAAVITKEPAKYHEDLAPYQENNMGDCPRQFLEFVDKTEEYTKEWQEDSLMFECRRIEYKTEADGYKTKVLDEVNRDDMYYAFVTIKDTK